MGFELGQCVADYEVVDVLGTGGMGCVYRVRNNITQRTEAMKVLLADLNAEPQLAARFRGEIRTLAGLDHPNIAQLRTALQAGNELVMVMEFVDGCTLHELARQAPLPQEKIIDYMQQTLAALSYAHGCGVVHRDIKPANIMVTPQGTVKLTDFGIAKSRRKDDLTRPGTTLGSLNYMSPEQALGNATVDLRSDLYSVGITMYELLAGKRPFDDESAFVVLQRQLNVAPQPPIELNPELSRPLSDLILRSLEKDPALRFQNAKEFSDALYLATHYIEGEVPARGAIKTVGRRFGKADRRKALAARPAVVSLAVSNHSQPPAAPRGRSRAVAAIVLFAMVGAGVPWFFLGGALAKTTSPTISVAPSAPAVPPDALMARTVEPVTMTGPTTAPAESSAPAPRAPQAKTLPEPAKRIVARSGAPSGRRSKDEEDVAANHAEQDLPKEEVDVAPVLSPATLAAVQAMGKQKQELEARAGLLRARVTRLRSEKAIEGRPLNQEIADAYVDMNEYLGAENVDLESGNVSAAQTHMQKAAHEMSFLEKQLSQ